MPQLITTSVVRGSHQGESHGGVYLIDIEGNEILKPVDWNTLDIDWSGRGWDRGLRGIAFHNGKIIIAASDMLLFFDQQFNIVDSFSNKYLKHCHELSIHGDHLFATSTGYDSILGFNLTTKEFDWGLTIVSRGTLFGCKRFDPRADDGPLLLNKMHINNVFCDQGGMYISGRRTKALLRFDGEKVSVMTTLPLGVHNARPYRGGVLFNDTEADSVRFEDPNVRRAWRIPKFAEHKLTHTYIDDTKIARQGFARGLCIIDEGNFAVGSSPSTVSIYDMERQRPNQVANLSLDIRNAIHGLSLWPYPWPNQSS